MIDAYEIGIQLMLQDDVSAGLEVINRGLAEVDRAIAATSVNLAGLGRQADTATKAASVASNSRTDLAATNIHKVDENAEQVNPGQSKQEPLAAPVAASAEKRATPEMKAAEPRAPARRTIGQPDIASIAPEPAVRDTAVAANAPISAAVDKPFRSDQQARNQQTQAQATPPNAPERAPPAASISSELVKRPIRETAPAGQERRRDLPTPVAITASVKRDQRSGTNVVRQERTEYQSTSSSTSRRERPVAPWSGITDQGAQGQQVRLSDKAAAPKSAGQDQSASGGGTVMLDGRLVGQWLSEHMARQASRPPAGTSFFDPRQTPAWNVSGAL